MRAKYLVAIGLSLMVLFSPTLLMIGWRVLYSARVSCRGVTVNVPYGWLPAPTSWRDTPSPELIKMPLTILSGHSHGFMSLKPNLAPSKVFDEGSFQVWRTAFESLYSSRGYEVQGPIHPGGNAYCLTAQPRTNNDGDTIADCYLLRGEWYASFKGPQS